jgi:hypothetical protein
MPHGGMIKFATFSRTAMRSCGRTLRRPAEREKIMTKRSSIAACGLLALCASISGAAAADDAKYPDLRGQWDRVGAPRWVQAGQKAPLTPEYQRVYDANLAEWPAAARAMCRHGIACRRACR